MAEKEKTRVSIIAIIGFVITAVAIAVIPLIVVKAADRSPFFIYYILWSEFLALLLWFVIGGFFALILPPTLDRRGRSAILMPLSLIIILYVIFSFALMMLYAFLGFLGVFFLPVQIGLFVVAAAICLIFYFSFAATKTHAQPLPDGVPTPTELGAILAAQEKRFSPAVLGSDIPEGLEKVFNALKGLREKIQYSLPRQGNIAGSNAYLEFTKEVQNVTGRVATTDAEGGDFLPMVKELDSLRRKVDVIAASLKK